jgi:hypothetical protein
MIPKKYIKEFTNNAESDGYYDFTIRTFIDKDWKSIGASLLWPLPSKDNPKRCITHYLSEEKLNKFMQLVKTINQEEVK